MESPTLDRKKKPYAGAIRLASTYASHHRGTPIMVLYWEGKFNLKYNTISSFHCTVDSPRSSSVSEWWNKNWGLDRSPVNPENNYGPFRPCVMGIKYSNKIEIYGRGRSECGDER